MQSLADKFKRSANLVGALGAQARVYDPQLLYYAHYKIFTSHELTVAKVQFGSQLAINPTGI